MPYIFVCCQISHLDNWDAFDATRWQSDKITYIDFQQVYRTLIDVVGKNLSGRRHDRNERAYDEKKPHFQTYRSTYPPHVVFNELEIRAGYKVIEGNTAMETFVWTLHKP